MPALYRCLTLWPQALACQLGEVCSSVYTQQFWCSQIQYDMSVALALCKAELRQCHAGSMLAIGMALAVLLLVLEGVLDTSGWVLGLFGISPGRCLGPEKEACLAGPCTGTPAVQITYVIFYTKGADACCAVAVQLSVPANIVTIITSLILFKLAQVAIVYAASGIRRLTASMRRSLGAPRTASSTTAGEGDSEIPTAGTRCASPLHALIVCSCVHIVTTQRDMVSQPLKCWSNGADLTASTPRWKTRAPTLPRRSTVCGRPTATPLRCCPRTAPRARSCAAASRACSGW